jgi:hypothetical protein
MASGDTAPIKTPLDQPALAHNDKDNAASHHSLWNDAYNFVATHQKEAEAVATAAVIGGATLALKHYMPAPVAEKIATGGASILERTLGIAATPNTMQELRVLGAPGQVESLIADLRLGKTTSAILDVKNVQTGAEFRLLTGHSPIAKEATAGADFVATCDPPLGSKSIFDQQKGPVFFNFDERSRTLRLSETEPISQRIGRFFKRDQEGWVPLGPHASTDLRALRADRAVMPKLENVNAANGQTENSARAIVAKWESQQRIINRNADTQDYMSNLIRNEMLPELKASGKISNKWKFVSTQVNSASDSGGADGIFAHEDTGQAHFIDYSTSPFKRIRPVGESPNVRRAGITERSKADDADFENGQADGMRDKKIAAVKAPGLIGFDNRWFDAMGKLDIENPEAATFRKELAEHLTDLTHAPAYFTVGKTPFASIVLEQPATQIKQLENLKQWSLKESGKSDSLHAQGYRDYAVSIDKSIGYLKSTFTEAGDSRHFRNVVQSAADQTIFRWAVDKVRTSVALEERAAARGMTTNLGAEHRGAALRFVPEKGILRFEHEGRVYASDALTGQNGLLDKSRVALLKEGRIKKMFDDMGNKQKEGLLTRLGSPGRPATEERAIREINSVLTNYVNEIKAGGQLGVPQKGFSPPLVQRIKDRVQIQSVSTLTRPVDLPAPVAKLDPKNVPRMQ